MKTTVILNLAFFSSAYAEAYDETSFHSPRLEAKTHMCFQKKYERSSYCKRWFQNIHKANQPKTSQIEERIIGGSDAPKDAYPWFVKALENYFQPEFMSFCGGMLVAPDWILTAAHCTALLPVENVSFQIGALSNPTDGDNGGQYSEIFSAEYIVEFPDYNYYDQYDNSNDFALVKLKGHSTISPVDMDLTGITNSYDSDKKLWTLGFGVLDILSDTTPDWLQHVDVSFVSQDICEDKYTGLFKITDNMMCAAGPDKDSCSGDSGGPLYDRENDKVVGVVSFGEGCADPQYTGVYAKISSQVEWIQETICSDTDVEVLSFCEGYTNAPTVSKEPSISPTVSFVPSISLDPTLSPSLSHVPTIECDDVPGWVDSLGASCDFYDFNDFCEYGNGYPGTSGLTANDACCICGGGVGTYPTVAPTASSVPTVACNDVIDWVDSNDLGCDAYLSDEVCECFGDSFEGTSGLTANEACCKYGGGLTPTLSPVAQTDVKQSKSSKSTKSSLKSSKSNANSSKTSKSSKKSPKTSKSRKDV